MFKGPKASDNPWEATTLEWTTATPPPHDNFGGKTPVVNHGPYEYSVPGASEGFRNADGPGDGTDTLAKIRGRGRPRHTVRLMATLSSTVTISDPAVKDPKTGYGSGGTRPPCRVEVAAITAAMALPTTVNACGARALGLLVGLVSSTMVFVSFTSVYIMRRGLPTLDDRTGGYVHDWLQVSLPTGLLLVNTCF